MSAPDEGRPRIHAGVALLIACAASGCTMLGGNVKGSFSCAAPDGICAPTSTIDDQALALVTGEGENAATRSAKALQERAPHAPARPFPTQTRATGAQIEAGRTQERVLRIVFLPFIDAHGRLHEASAVHAVVRPGEWYSQASADATSIAHAPAPAAGQASLAEMVDRADRLASLPSIDPDLPDTAVVAAARARKADPMGAIRAQVAARLEARPARIAAPRANGQILPAGKDRPTDLTTRTSGKPQAPRTPREATQVSAVTEPSPLAGTSAAVREKPYNLEITKARVKADPQYRAAANAAQRTAQQAAGSVLPEVKAPTGPTVRAATFPAAITQDK